LLLNWSGSLSTIWAAPKTGLVVDGEQIAIMIAVTGGEVEEAGEVVVDTQPDQVDQAVDFGIFWNLRTGPWDHLLKT
jgi:hypothetical protein